MNYYEALKKIWTPEIGSIWKAPNSMWISTGFAPDKSKYRFHPAVLGKINSDNITASMVPGTSSKNNGSCVYKTNLGDKDRITHFLIKLSMPYNIEDLKDLEIGWMGIKELNENQKIDFSRQIKLCRG